MGDRRQGSLRVRAVLAVILAAALVAAPIGRAQTCGQWERVGLSARSGLSMAYDSGRGVIVMFGGIDGTLSGETWEWDGAWTRRAIAGPSPRFGHQLAYDSARGVTVLFGGRTSLSPSVLSKETWEWDGVAGTWTLRATDGPLASYRHGMAYDAGAGQTLLVDQGATWSWDGQAWTLRSTSGASYNYSITLAYDAARRVMVSYADGKTREWDGVAWTQVANGEPSPRWYMPITYDSARQRIVMYGGLFQASLAGFPDHAFDETWEWDGKAWTLRKLESIPWARFRQGAAYDAARGRTVMFGGEGHLGGDSSATSETWEWDGSDQGWTLTAEPGPPERSDAAVAYDAARGRTVLFGGYSGSLLNDTWTWEGEEWTRRTPAHSPSPRWGSPAVYDAARQVTVLFSGYVQGGPAASDTWEWDGTDWTLRATNGPSPRYVHAMAYDSKRGVTVLFGGLDDASDASGETWEWNGTDWTLRATGGPAARTSSAMAYDAARGVTVLLGGWIFNQFQGHDTWEWDGSQWTSRTDLGPPAISDHAMTYDAALQRVILHGGNVGGEDPVESDQTWVWDGASWTLLTMAGPARFGHSMAYDPVRRVHLLFGGAIALGPVVLSLTSQTWRYAPDPWIESGPADLTVEAGGAASFAVSAQADGTASYQWRRDGEPLANGGDVSGADSATLVIDPAAPSDHATYDVIVTSACGQAVSDPATLTVHLTGDITGDGSVDIDDLFAVINTWGACPSPGAEPCAADVTGDNTVDVDDLFTVINHWT